MPIFGQPTQPQTPEAKNLDTASKAYIAAKKKKLQADMNKVNQQAQTGKVEANEEAGEEQGKFSSIEEIEEYLKHTGDGHLDNMWENICDEHGNDEASCINAFNHAISTINNTAEDEEEHDEDCPCQACQWDKTIKHSDMTKNESIQITNFIKSISKKNYAQADKYLQGTVESKIKSIINRAINK